VSLHALGLTGRSAVLVWVQNRESLWYYWDRPTPTPVSGAQLLIRGAPQGRMRVEWLDTWTGRWTRKTSVTVEGDAVELPVPPVTRDIACRLLPSG